MAVANVTLVGAPLDTDLAQEADMLLLPQASSQGDKSAHHRLLESWGDGIWDYRANPKDLRK